MSHPSFTGRRAHAALLVACAAFLLAGAFHGYVWYDESFSVALVKKGFADIWRIDAADVHPPLYYLVLHLLYLVFGTNVTVYRLFSVAGAIATGALGLTHVRRDFGARAGMLFTFFACVMPNLVYYATQIRMYSWVTFTVTLCFLEACRIRELSRSGAAAPRREWAAFALASLASAYLHYYGAMAAFLVNVLLLVALACDARRRQRGAAGAGSSGKRSVAVLLALAAGQLAAFAPWAVALLGQMGSISTGGYWINLDWPVSYLQILGVPLLADRLIWGLIDGQSWVHGAPPTLWYVAGVITVTFAGTVVANARAKNAAERWAGGIGMAVYLGVIALAWLAGTLVHTPILFYRYMAVAAGPMLVALSLAFGREGAARPAALATARWACVAVVLAFSVRCQADALPAAYAPDNAVPGAAFARIVGENGGTEATPVIASDYTMMGVLDVEHPEIAQTYPNWLMHYWNGAYEAYAPAVSMVQDIAATPAGTSGKVVFMAEKPEDEAVQRAEDFSNMLSGQIGGQRLRVEGVESYRRPYDKRIYTFVTLTREEL